jgi:uncharacterized protein YndB with AHSA1/START domain
MDSLAKASVIVNAPAAEVWKALVTPETVKQYMFGATVASEWRPGSPITWKGEWQGKPFEDKGVILAFEPRRRLQYSHFSPLSEQPDRPENYHTVTIDLAEEGPRTRISLTQDKNPTEEARRHSEANWGTMLAGLKKVVER